MVKELRDKTGAGMMDCKAALGETNADLEAAVDWLRKKGLAKAAKKAGRIAAEGLIGVAVGGLKGVVIEVNSETDFVARNEQFQGLVRMIADVALDVGPDVEAIKAGKVGAVTINDAKIGVIVALESPGQKDELTALGRQVAMHIAASNPQAIDPSGLDPHVVAREKDILADKFRAQGKAEAVIVKIVESGLKTFYKEVCLLEQPYIHDPAKSVAQALKDAEGKVGGAIKVTGFVHYKLGEGIDRPDSDFGGEVAAMAGR
jgi:elongation factor Ts